jgi:hypothetical protein
VFDLMAERRFVSIRLASIGFSKRIVYGCIAFDGERRRRPGSVFGRRIYGVGFDDNQSGDVLRILAGQHVRDATPRECPHKTVGLTPRALIRAGASSRKCCQA